MMGEDRNLLRRFCRADRPVAHGLHVIGDARAQTNNLYAWGVGLAFWQASVLNDCLAAHPNDEADAALEFEALVGPELEARQALAVRRDRARAVGAGGERHDGDVGGYRLNRPSPPTWPKHARRVRPRRP